MVTTLESRAQPPAGLALLRSGHRLFFLGTAVWGASGLLAWLAGLHGLLRVDAAWHGHEAIWGFAAAAIAGFLTAAVPKWTSSRLFAGLPAASLFLLWLAGRVAMAAGVWTWIDLLFLPVMAAAVFRRLWRARNLRNYQVAALVLALAAANVAWHDGQRLIATRAAVLLIVALIALIGGRIIPGFTRNFVLSRGGDGRAIGPDLRLEPFVVPALVLGAGVELVAPLHPASGALQVALAGLMLWRWRGWGWRQSLGAPIVWVLHAAYLFLPLGLLLGGLAPLVGWSPMAGLHALTAGGIGGMIVAVASRAARGHAGVPLQASRATVATYALILGGAALRTAAPFLGNARPLLDAAGTLWALGWVVFAIEHAPMLLRARRDGQPG
jgi:uncharacterized protein involved in response to NO